MTGASPDRSSRLPLAGFVLDLQARELRSRDGQPVDLRRKALQVLLVLGEQAGHVVDKNTLMRRVWPGVVVGDDSLTQVVAEIRRVLGDNERRLLRTAARRGFALMPDTPSAAQAPPLSVAVLPVVSSGGDGEMVAAAFTVALAARVGRGLSGSKVIAGDVARLARASSTDPRTTARELGVQQVVTGELRPDAQVWCASLAVIDGESGVRLWGREFTLDREPAAERLNDIASQAARAVLVQMHRSAAAHAARKPATERSADELALQGWASMYEGLTPNNIERALGFFGLALARDAGSLRGLGGWASGHLCSLTLGCARDPAAALAHARSAAARLEQLYPDDTLTWIERCAVSGAEGRGETALVIAHRMCERDPANPTAHFLRASNLLRVGRFDDCVAAVRRTFTLSVDDFRAALWYQIEATAQLMRGEPEQALTAARQAIAANACLRLPPILQLAALLALGRAAEARAALATHLVSDPECTATLVESLLDGTDPRYLAARAHILRSLRMAGLP
jgi:DNA-binding winged helix-turn-helix (wHTH) protein/tetratricopeptide (TPR) repeat protein